MTYKEKLLEVKRAKEELKEWGKQAFKEGSEQLFKGNPTLESFGWHEYTPYWNDGDVCRFCVCNEEPTINGISPYYDNDNDQEWDSVLAGKVAEFLCGFDKDFYETTFGDHVEITVFRDGHTKIDSYQHD